MIFESAIRGYTKTTIDFPTELQIMEEYYQNEISILNMAIDYRNSKSAVNESYIEAIHEGFVNNVIEKVKLLIKKFLEWLRSIKDSVMKLFKKNRMTNSQRNKKVKEELEELDRLQKQAEDLSEVLNTTLKAARKMDEVFNCEGMDDLFKSVDEELKKMEKDEWTGFSKDFDDALDKVTKSMNLKYTVDMFESGTFRKAAEPLFKIADEADNIINKLTRVNNEEDENKLYEEFDQVKEKVNSMISNNSKEKILERLEGMKSNKKQFDMTTENFNRIMDNDDYDKNLEDVDKYINKETTTIEGSIKKLEGIAKQASGKFKQPDRIVSITNFYIVKMKEIITIAEQYKLHLSNNNHYGTTLYF